MTRPSDLSHVWFTYYRQTHWVRFRLTLCCNCTSSSLAVKNGSCLLTPDKRIQPGFRNQVPEETSPLSPACWSTRPATGCGTRSTSLLVHRTSSVNCQEMETCMVRACYTPWWPLQGHPSGHLRGGQCCGQQQKCWKDNIRDWTPCPCRDCTWGPPAEGTEGGSLLNHPSCSPDDLISHGIELDWSPWGKAILMRDHPSFQASLSWNLSLSYSMQINPLLPGNILLSTSLLLFRIVSIMRFSLI